MRKSLSYNCLISLTNPFFQSLVIWQWGSDWISHKDLAMLHALLDHVATACIIGLQMVLVVNTSDVSKPVCQQRQIQPTKRAQRCVSDTEVYINTTGVGHHCMCLCMRNPNRQVINFNILGSYCLIGERPCIYVENDTEFVTTIMSMRKPSLKWVNSFYEDEHIISFLEAPDLNNFIGVARCMMGNNKIPGKMVMPNGAIFCSWDDAELLCQDQTEILTLSPEYNISWVPYNSASGNPLPPGIVIGGQLNGVPLYVARKYEPFIEGFPLRYALGYYNQLSGLGHFGYLYRAFNYQAVELLVVQEWYVS